MAPGFIPCAAVPGEFAAGLPGIAPVGAPVALLLSIPGVTAPGAAAGANPPASDIGASATVPENACPGEVPGADGAPIATRAGVVPCGVADAALGAVDSALDGVGALASLAGGAVPAGTTVSRTVGADDVPAGLASLAADPGDWEPEDIEPDAAALDGVEPDGAFDAEPEDAEALDAVPLVPDPLDWDWPCPASAFLPEDESLAVPVAGPLPPAGEPVLVALPDAAVSCGFSEDCL